MRHSVPRGKEDCVSLYKTFHFGNENKQNQILDSLEEQLLQETLIVTKNRKQLRPNKISTWELRIDNYQVFYDVNIEENLVIIKVVAKKEHNP